MSDENTIWKGSPSQWLNLGPFIVALLFAGGVIFGSLFFPPALIGLIIPALYMLWRFLEVRTRVFELTNERLRVTRGVFNQQIDEIELYRVKDSQTVRPWWMRLTGLSSILLETSDRSMPHLIIPAIAGGVKLRELLRTQVELERDRKRVRETDFDDAGHDGPEA